MTDQTIKIMTDLAQLDIDAVHAYEKALEQIDDDIIYRQIASFRNDHLQHIDDLSRLISQYGGKPPERTLDFKGYFIEGFTAVRSLTGTKGALSAMEGNEKTTNKKYEEALSAHPNLPSDVRALLEKNYSDEKRHLAYIKQTLATWKEVEKDHS